jgi:hypothetical protein
MAVTGAGGDTPFTATAGDHLIHVAGSAYRVRLADFGFPAAFSAVPVGAPRDGALLRTLGAAGTLSLPHVSTGKLFGVVIAASAGTVVTLSVIPGQVASGSAIDLGWAATNLPLASGGWSGSRPLSGNEHLNTSPPMPRSS